MQSVSFDLFLQFVYGLFCVVFAGLVSVEGFVGNCCFWLLFILFSIFFVFSLDIVEESTFYRCDI